MKKEKTPHKNKKILIVDDDVLNLETMKVLLEEESYCVAIAVDRETCLEEIKKEELPDLILLDYLLPGVNGLDILCEIKKIYPDICIIMFTAYGDNELWVKALGAGVYDVLPKPVKIPDLLTLLQKALK